MQVAIEPTGIDMRPIRRGSTFHLRKRVPVRFKSVEPRMHVWITLKTDSENDAKRKSNEVWNQMIGAWEAMLAGSSQIGLARYEAARNLAHARGITFLPAKRVAELPIDDILNRVEASIGPKGRLDPVKASAFLGTAEKPEITVSAAEKLFFDLSWESTQGKNADQIRRWENPRKKAIRNFISVAGDMAISDITADDMLNFRFHWEERIQTQGLTANSANKDLVHFCGMLRFVNKRKQLGITFPFSDLMFREKKSQRVPFSDKWIKEKIIGNPALMNLNVEARSILLGMINTGYRPSEVINLGAEQICLDGDYPHLKIEPVGRALKTDRSERIIPLVGVSLDAFKLCPTGFPRYFDTTGASNTINKFMRENGMMETDDHTLYGLRHSFEDRMLAAEIDERIRRDFMGHALGRQQYGHGATLEHMHRVLQPIAL